MTGRKIIGYLLIAAAAIVFALWSSGRVAHPFAPVVALMLLLAAASFFRTRLRVVEQLRSLLGKNITVLVWGADLPDAAGASFSLDRVLALGAGLHIYLRASPDGSSVHLKVAQPRGVSINDTRVEIAEAKYVQWAGRKIQAVAGAKALVLIVV